MNKAYGKPCGRIVDSNGNKQAVQDAVRRMINPKPQLGDGHRRQQHRDQVNFAEQIRPLDPGGQHHRDDQIQNQAKHREDRQQARMPRAAPECLVLHQRFVMAQTDERHRADAVPFVQAVKGGQDDRDIDDRQYQKQGRQHIQRNHFLV